MQRLDGQLIYSASDLNDYLECKRLTDLEALVARGPAPSAPIGRTNRPNCCAEKAKPTSLHISKPAPPRCQDDIVAFERGENSVDAYRQAEQETLAAMRRGFARSTRRPSSTARSSGAPIFCGASNARPISAATATKSWTRSSGCARSPTISCRSATTANISSGCRAPCRSSGTSCSETARSGAFASTIISRTIATLKATFLAFAGDCSRRTARRSTRLSVRMQALRDLRVERRVRATASRRRSPQPRRFDAARPNREARSGRALPTSRRSPKRATIAGRPA